MSEQKQKIAIVCANLPERNTGMVTVDLAAHTVIRSNFPQAEITLYSFSKDDKKYYKTGETSHEYLDVVEHANRFLDSDVFLYWGDFIHSNSYWEYDMKLWNKELNNLPEPEKEQALRKQHNDRSKYIFLSQASSAQLKKAVVFGSTIITNDANDANDSLYTNDFNRFFSSIQNVFFRDALSAAKISPLRSSEATLACDCALLLKNEDLYALDDFNLASERNGVGIFLGRSRSKLSMLMFTRMIGHHLHEQCTWFPWIISTAKLRRVARIFGYKVPEKDVSPGQLLSELSGYRFIVTDTYHVCINAWRMGIPAVCIGQGSGAAITSIADKKKEIAYEMYGARRLYVFLETIGNLRAMWAESKRVSEVLQDELLTSTIAKNVQDHRKMALARLLNALKSILDAQEQKAASPMEHEKIPV